MKYPVLWRLFSPHFHAHPQEYREESILLLLDQFNTTRGIRKKLKRKIGLLVDQNNINVKLVLINKILH
jgi:hypothetical protein